MKKRLAAFTAAIALLLSGCGSSAEKVNCYECGDLVDRWIDTANWEQVCASCFVEKEYRVCMKCGLVYKPGYADDADGYCGGCAETETWYCAYCEERMDINDMVEVDDGYFLCAECVYREAKPFDNAFTETFSDYLSPFDISGMGLCVSRNEYLGLESETFAEDTETSVFDDAYQEKYFSSYGDGYTDGYDEGYTDGYDTGREEGRDEGYKSGYADGVTAGKAAAKVSVSSSGYSGITSNKSSGNSTVNSDTQTVTVYITKTGEKYHRYGCQYLRQSCISISLSDAKARGYTACSKCW